MFSFLAYYPYKKLSKGGGIMTKIQALSALLAGTVLFSSTGCSLGKNKEKKKHYHIYYNCKSALQYEYSYIKMCSLIKDIPTFITFKNLVWTLRSLILVQV